MNRLYSVLIGGEAGQGIDRTAILLGKIAAASGYSVFIYRDYPSLIRGGHNYSILTFGDGSIGSQEEKVDLLIALDKETYEIHKTDLKKQAVVFSKKEAGLKNGLVFDISEFLKEKGYKSAYGNNVFLGAFVKYFGLPLKMAEKVIKIEFGPEKSEEINEFLKIGYDQAKEVLKLNIYSEKEILNGSQAIAQGALDSEANVFFSYPMTPATAVFDELKKSQAGHKKIKVEQLEDEIAVINAGLGASFAGATAMVGSSGGGLDLMAEGVSLSGIAEIPLVIYWAMRQGPSTGVPTYTSQSDLKSALNIGHGEFPRLVVAPGDSSEAYQKTREIFYLASKYRLPAIILSDKHLADSVFTFKKDVKKIPKVREFIETKSGALSYKLTFNGLSKRLIPGGKSIARANSYEHDEFGFTTEDSEMVKSMVEKREKKSEFLAKEISKFKPINTFGKGKKLIISWGSTKGAIQDLLKDFKDVKFLQIVYLEPFPTQEVLKEIKKAKEVILIENNAKGLLGQLIEEKTGCEIKKKILKYSGRPFTVEELKEELKKWLRK